MSSATFRAQDDFSTLGLAETLDDSHGIPALDRAEPLKSDSTCATSETYRPDNFIPTEVYELFRIWDLAFLKQQKTETAFMAIDSVHKKRVTDSGSTELVCERLLIMSGSAPPPKRFYRTFWRSLTLRVVRLEKKKAVERAVMSNSDASDDN
jgi:hypothetical protein